MRFKFARNSITYTIGSTANSLPHGGGSIMFTVILSYAATLLCGILISASGRRLDAITMLYMGG